MHSDLRIIYQKGGSRDAAGLKEELSSLKSFPLSYLLPPIRTLPLDTGTLPLDVGTFRYHTDCALLLFAPAKKNATQPWSPTKASNACRRPAPTRPPRQRHLGAAASTNARTHVARGQPPVARRGSAAPTSGGTRSMIDRARRGTAAPTSGGTRSMIDRARRPQCYATPTPTRSRARWPRRTRT